MKNREVRIAESVAAGMRKADSGDVPMYMNVSDFFNGGLRPDQVKGAMGLISEAQDINAREIWRLMKTTLRSSRFVGRAVGMGLIIRT